MKGLIKGLIKVTCKYCSTVFYSQCKEKREEQACYLCGLILMFSDFFKLKGLDVNEVDFRRVREPYWGDMKPGNKKDWRNYIPSGLQNMWAQLPYESRLVAFMFAEREARREK